MQPPPETIRSTFRQKPPTQPMLRQRSILSPSTNQPTISRQSTINFPSTTTGIGQMTRPGRGTSQIVWPQTSQPTTQPIQRNIQPIRRNIQPIQPTTRPIRRNIQPIQQTKRTIFSPSSIRPPTIQQTKRTIFSPSTIESSPAIKLSSVPSPKPLAPLRPTISAPIAQKIPVPLTQTLPNQPVDSEKKLYQDWRNLYQDPTLLLLDPILSWERRYGPIQQNRIDRRPNTIYPGSQKQDQMLPVPSPLKLLEKPISIGPPNQEILSTVEENSSGKESLQPDSELIDLEPHSEIELIKHHYQLPIFKEKVENLTNPFAGIGNSSYVDQNAVILANCDAIFGITADSFGGYLFFKNKRLLIFCDLGGGPGGNVEYIQQRFPNAFGYGLSPRSEDLYPSETSIIGNTIDWNLKALEEGRFLPIYGRDGSGDILSNADWMAHYVLEEAPMRAGISPAKLRQGRGVDLVTATNNYLTKNGKEVSTFPILIAETLIALQILWPAGTFFLRFFGLSHLYSADLLMLITNLFEEVTLFKPISSKPDNSHLYVIAKGYQGPNEGKESIQLLREALRRHQEGQTLLRLLSGEYQQFWNQLKDFNNQMLARQLHIGRINIQMINSFLEKGPNKQKDLKKISARKYTLRTEIPSYPLNYALAYWNIFGSNPILKEYRASRRRTPIEI